MQKNIFFLIMGFSLCLLNGCGDDEDTKEVIVTIDENGHKVKTGDIGGVISDLNPVTRVFLENQGNKSYDGENFFWQKGDQISVIFGSDGATSAFNAVEIQENESSFTIFQGNISDVTYDVTYAMYPMISGGSVADGFEITMPSTMAQQGRTTDHLSLYMFMYAVEQNVNWYSDQQAILNFKQIGGLYCYRLKNRSSQTIPLSSVFMQKSRKFKDKCSVLLNKDGSVVLTPSGRSSEVLVETDIDLAIGDSCDIYQVFLPTQGMTGISLGVTTRENSIFVPEDGDEEYFSNTVNISMPDVESGKVYYLKLVLNDDIMGLASTVSKKPSVKLEFEGYEVVDK